MCHCTLAMYCFTDDFFKASGHLGDYCSSVADTEVIIIILTAMLHFGSNFDGSGSCCGNSAVAIPAAEHVFSEKQIGQVFFIERFNCTLRRLVSRLVRKSLSFSKSKGFHEEAIRYFNAHYNQECQKLFEHYL